MRVELTENGRIWPIPALRRGAFVARLSRYTEAVTGCAPNTSLECDRQTQRSFVQVTQATHRQLSLGGSRHQTRPAQRIVPSYLTLAPKSDDSTIS